ncbi:MAG TPA: hypothetical protein K8V61_01275 [Bacteroides clarus]|uniref:hypothetical protein n=1 Tax=Bacteroides clarus TaxID=626929 RepID=UPI001DF4B207|nr:hypothetical protein [Bacteroides clarus]HJF97907.1 hypothetical protein [Bacteroides clarus]
MDNKIVKKRRKNIFKAVKVRETLLSIGVGETEIFKIPPMNYNSTKVTASNLKKAGKASFKLEIEKVKAGKEPKYFKVIRKE